MRIGDIYNKDGLKGVVVYVDNSGVHGLIMSLDEAFLNWYESDKWCKNLGDGWFMPSVKDFEQMKNDDNLNQIQNTLIRVGMPMCFGDKDCQGNNKDAHMYWTRDLQANTLGHDFMWVFCLGYNGFSQMSSDYKEAKYSYIRAMHRV
ncbi:MAG: hypothetical protein J6V55_05100 [Alistipes sp.]|nr:hypothetical protein [Alistipes sp.]